MPEDSAADLRIGGLVRFSTVDWPGELVSTVFLQGCPWRCPYCHNGHLLEALPDEGVSLLPWSDVLQFLATRTRLLDGVVFSGGEPLAQASLSKAVEQVAEQGFKVGLHTNGMVPDRFARLLPALSWVGFDVKAPFAAYERVTGVPGSGDRALESLLILSGSETPFEVRTTVDPALLGLDDLLRMANELRDAGVAHWVIQPARYPSDTTAGARTAEVRALLRDVDTTRFTSVEIRG